MSKRHRVTRKADPASQQVYGVNQNQIFDVFADLYASAEPSRDGLCVVNLTLSNERAEPFLRALLRAEAELLIADAARPDLSTSKLRSPDNRGHDALTLLTWRTFAARGIPDCASHIQALFDDAPDEQAA